MSALREPESESPAQYLFIVARNRPDILARVRERLRGDLRIEVIVDRRRAERRTSVGRHVPERRRAERRRPTRHWDDLSVYPTLVVQKRPESYAELQQKLMAGDRESQGLREENERLRAENAQLHEVLADAEHAVGALIEQFQARLAQLSS